MLYPGCPEQRVRVLFDHLAQPWWIVVLTSQEVFDRLRRRPGVVAVEERTGPIEREKNVSGSLYLAQQIEARLDVSLRVPAAERMADERQTV